MKVLLVHNRYRHAGGEDEVFRAEASLLRAAGHDVAEYLRTNDDVVADGPVAALGLAVNTVWSRHEAESIRRTVRDRRPDVVHFHNTLPLISPAAYYACRGLGVPVVQTLHNYRLVCPSANLFREGRVCEACIESGLSSSVRHGCYRGSRAATATVATMVGVHRALGTWRDQVDIYIALSDFARKKFIEAGLPDGKVLIKPNFVDPDPGVRHAAGTGGVFIGRFWPEKGARTLLNAWTRLPSPARLELLGDGPERTELEALAAGRPDICFRGRVPRAETTEAMKGAAFLVFPSEWYEGLPMTIIEAFACGVPVITTRLGTMAEVVADGVTGLHYTPGDAGDLAAKVRWAHENPEAMAAMGRAARREFEARYTAAQNLSQMLAIYERAIDGFRRVRNQNSTLLPVSVLSGTGNDSLRSQ